MLIDIHTHHKHSSQTQVSIFNILIEKELDIRLNDNQLYSAGIHPWNIDEIRFKQQLEILENLSRVPTVVAIGEAGLDKSRGAEFQRQLEIFKHHIDLSEKLQKPLIIHCVKAFNEIIKLKNEVMPHQPWIIHGFRQNNQIAIQLLNAGMKLSFGKSILTDNRFDTLFINVLEDDFFFETDEAEVDTLSLIYEKVAGLKGISIQILEKKQIANFERIFKTRINV
jgi:TatD DNase family protein